MSFGKVFLGTLLLVSTAAAAQVPKQNWKRIDADNGAAYAIDLNSISRGSGKAEAVICIVENNECGIMNMRRWIFYCPQNRFTQLTDAGFTPSVYVPPRSVGKRILDIACGEPKKATAPSSTQATESTAATFYRSRYFLAGFLLRAANVCDGDSKRTIDASVGLLDTAELKTISKAYPQNTQRWMEEGANNFNTGTMKDGVGAACAMALEALPKAEEIAKVGR